MDIIERFASEENINLLTNAIISKLKEKNIDIANNFYDLFNNVASSVLNYEKERGKSLSEINEIIFRETVKLFTSKPVEKAKKIDASTNTYTFNTCKKIVVLDEGENLLNIENVVNIEVMSFNLNPAIYNITEANNKIIYNDDKIISIEPGNYSIQSLLKSFSKTELSLKYNEITMKITISFKKATGLDIDSFKSKGLLQVLGFSDSQSLCGEKEYVSKGVVNLNCNVKNISIYCDESLFFSQDFVGNQIYKEVGCNSDIFPLNVKCINLNIKGHYTLNLKNNVLVCVEFVKKSNEFS